MFSHSKSPVLSNWVIAIAMRRGVRGIATEVGRAVLDHAFHVLEIDPIVAVRHPENRASARVLEKLGFQDLGLQFHYGLDLPFHRLTRADFDQASVF